MGITYKVNPIFEHTKLLPGFPDEAIYTQTMVP